MVQALAAVFRWLASLKLAVVLILVLAAVLAWATLLESSVGRDYAQWYVYKSPWFVALLAVLGLNILASTLIRFPWIKSRRGFVITHAGLLVLLFGAIQTFRHGVEGQLIFAEGQSVDSILMLDKCQLNLAWQTQPNRSPLAFTFRPGPVDWPPGETLDLGELDGVQLKVLRFLRHAKSEENWVADESGGGGPAIKFAVADPRGKTVLETWLAAGPFGAEFSLGPATFVLQRAPVASLVEDFLKPPGKEIGARGVLSMHLDGRMVRVGVAENLGKKIPLGDGKIRVQIEKYLPNAQPDPDAHFVSHGQQPDNPMLELKVYLPGKEQPLRQIAFARHPLLGLDGIHGQPSPVKFWYHHPAAVPSASTELLQTPDGKLYCRAAIHGAFHPHGELKAGDKVEAAAGFKITLLKHLPHSRKEVLFSPVALAAGETAGPEAAALVEVGAGKTRQQVWLQRGDENYGFQVLQTKQGPLAMGLDYERLPLGFELKLVKFRHGKNPGQMGDASFASTVELVDRAMGIDQQRTISMNEPLVYGKYTLYQSSFQDTPDGKQASTLTVACDPGRLWKYVGSLMICGGAFLMFFCRAIGWKTIPFLPSGRKSDHGAPTVNSSRKHLARPGKNGAKPSLAGSRQDS